MSIQDFVNQFVFFCFFALILFAAMSDAASYRIPNLISIGLLALFPIHVWASPTPVDWISALLVAAAGFAVGFVLFARGLVGGGDVKLLSATMLWAGATLVASQLIIMALVGGALSVAAIAIHYFRRRTADAAAPKVPYGIAIAAGAGYAGMKLLIG